ncbi:UPF0149 family protein [Piscinibacter koreensis]|uniref:UPF0149 family protein n=1 Tax=Piscinibacter koreensis TaxID=2742824 RepID=A0A7Y6NJG0_9BURK|nr:UPF0149 family protein [Schlegelella koreensis]NUZ04305.1 UPF0149 family protein [Schlegelella koreensis]
MPTSRTPSAATARDLSDAEFEELDRLLEMTPEPLEPLDAVMLDGYLCGVLVQPVLIDSDDWLPGVFDFDGRPLPEPGAGPVTRGGSRAWLERVRGLVERRHAALNRELAENGWFDPLILELDEASAASESDAAKREQLGIDAVSEPLLPWVAGFQHAAITFPALAEMADDSVQLALARLYRHLPAETDDERAVVETLRKESPLDSLDAAIEELVASVADLYDLTTDQRYKVETVKREAPKVGRNDPCWCGSGKKFKLCHGGSAGA